MARDLKERLLEVVATKGADRVEGTMVLEAGELSELSRSAREIALAPDMDLGNLGTLCIEEGDRATEGTIMEEHYGVSRQAFRSDEASGTYHNIKKNRTFVGVP